MASLDPMFSPLLLWPNRCWARTHQMLDSWEGMGDAREVRVSSVFEQRGQHLVLPMCTAICMELLTRVLMVPGLKCISSAHLLLLGCSSGSICLSEGL